MSRSVSASSTVPPARGDRKEAAAVSWGGKAGTDEDRNEPELRGSTPRGDSERRYARIAEPRQLSGGRSRGDETSREGSIGRWATLAAHLELEGRLCGAIGQMPPESRKQDSRPQPRQSRFLAIM